MAPNPKDADRKPGASRRGVFPAGGPAAADKKRLREKLLRLRVALVQSSSDLAEEALKSSGQDFSIDHMADYGSDNFEQDVSLSLLEGEAELLKAIEAAVAKIDGRAELPYGICEECAETDRWNPETTAPWIPLGRLDAVPYAQLCVRHQELQEGD